MSKIRINELARQLEVKSREVIDKLHELGIAEKVTHSSSIDEDRADQLRRYYRGESHAPIAANRNGSGAAVEEHVEPETRPAEQESAPPRPERRSRAAQPEPPASVPAPLAAALPSGLKPESATPEKS